ncbi:MAG TPA: M20/M25/M40 family metallo-hydrolase [Pseudogracilibacillus sp.]|nr:M20/M25/M40 family metallo-hydrolase [Pseudogracilibacillus sp.]
MENVNRKRLITQFKKLVTTDSETKDEGNIAQLLKETFTNLGVTVEEDDAKKMTGHGANNLICTLKGTNEKAEAIFFSAHMDTVKPGKNIKPQLIDNYITSDGSTILGADDKAGIAAMLELIHYLQENDVPHGDIQFIITVGEEAGLTGAKALDRSLVFAKRGFVLDSDGDVGNIVIEAPYHVKLFANITGKSAHAGIAPEKGVSAINVAAKAVSKMKLGRIDEETTANIGYFKGGKKEQTNVVSDFVEIEAEVRSLNETKVNRVTETLKETFITTANALSGEATVETHLEYPGYKITKDDPLVKTVKRATEKLHLPCNVLKSGGGSDANILNSYGLKTVNLSVGYEHIHTTKERIHIDSLVNLTKLLVVIVEEMNNSAT